MHFVETEYNVQKVQKERQRFTTAIYRNIREEINTSKNDYG
jgi:hypothetical protein